MTKPRFESGAIESASLDARLLTGHVLGLDLTGLITSAQRQLTADQLDDTKADARLVGVMPENGTVLLDVASADLGYLREKIEAFADDSKVTPKTNRDGTKSL